MDDFTNIKMGTAILAATTKVDYVEMNSHTNMGLHTKDYFHQYDNILYVKNQAYFLFIYQNFCKEKAEPHSTYGV